MPTRPKSCRLASATNGVAGAHQHVDRRDRLRPQGHRGDRLDAAEAVDLVRAREVLRRDDRGRGPPLIRRRAGDDPRDPRHLGGDDRHVGRGQQRIFPARHVAPRRADRDVLVAEDDPRQGLDLHVPQGLALVPGEVAHLRLGERDVLDVAPAELGQAALDLGRRQPVVVAVPPVEPDGELPDRRVPAPGDVVQDAFDRLADLRIRLRRLRPIHPALQPRLHRSLPLCGFLGDTGADSRRFERECQSGPVPTGGKTRQSWSPSASHGFNIVETGTSPDENLRPGASGAVLQGTDRAEIAAMRRGRREGLIHGERPGQRCRHTP